jgi:hypothetical protein
VLAPRIVGDATSDSGRETIGGRSNQIEMASMSLVARRLEIVVRRGDLEEKWDVIIDKLVVVDDR